MFDRYDRFDRRFDRFDRYKTIVYVGEQLLNGTAILLVDAYDYLQQAYNDNRQQESEPKLTVSSLWLLGNLTNNLQHHLEYSCASRKHGVLIYRSNANLASLLHKALYQFRQHKKKQPTNVEMLDALNSKILDQCQQFLSKHQAFCEDYSTIDIDKVIDDIYKSRDMESCILIVSIIFNIINSMTVPFILHFYVT